MVVALGAVDARTLLDLAWRGHVGDLARAVPLGRALAGVRRRFADGPRFDRVRADPAAALTAAKTLLFWFSVLPRYNPRNPPPCGRPYRTTKGDTLMLKEFKEFAMRGNVIDLAVGVIIGAAFGKIVSSLVEDII